MKVIAALLGALPDDATYLYLPVGEGVTGRTERVEGIAMMREDMPLPAGAEAYAVDERFQWDRGGDTVARIAELGFRTMHDVHHRNYDSPAGAAIIRRDIKRFLDVPAGWRMLAKRTQRHREP